MSFVSNWKRACVSSVFPTERSGLLLRVRVLQTGARQVAQEGLLSEGTNLMPRDRR